MCCWCAPLIPRILFALIHVVFSERIAFITYLWYVPYVGWTAGYHTRSSVGNNEKYINKTKSRYICEPTSHRSNNQDGIRVDTRDIYDPPVSRNVWCHKIWAGDPFDLVSVWEETTEGGDADASGAKKHWKQWNTYCTNCGMIPKGPTSSEWIGVIIMRW